MYGLYVHIPFCVSKCAYCDFLSFGAETESAMRRYTDALVIEIEEVRKKNLSFDTVYIGGGTPTALPLPFLLEIIGAVNRLDLLPGAEFTLEANPGTSFDFAALRQAGVNRLSLGLQAWQNPLLKSIGRIHTRREFISCYNAALEAGIRNINVDVMFALPGQTVKMWAETLENVAALKPKHISAYSLTPEEGTPLWESVKRGGTVLPGDDIDREMYHAACKFLADAGYAHYELSNFALAGYESKHNSRYWKRRPYLGVGLGAHSFDGNARWHNTPEPEKYLSLRNNAEDLEILTERDAVSEEMILGLRLMEGVPYNQTYAKEIDGLIKQGLLRFKDGRVALTDLGMDLANKVFIMFC